jgi:DNA primase
MIVGFPPGGRAATVVFGRLCAGAEQIASNFEGFAVAMPGIVDQAALYQIQQANDIAEVIGEHVSLKRKGREMVGLCPFHDDHRPSMYVNGDKQIFKCFACGAGGDVFKFVQMRENLTFGQAIERLAERAGIRLKPRQLDKTSPSEQQAEVDPNRLAKVNAWAAQHFQHNLSDGEKGKYARDYLAQRGISPDSIKLWQIGLAVNCPDDLIRAATAKKVPSDLLRAAGLVVSQSQDKFVNRLMFTITDVTGRVIGFGGRTLDESGAKYVNSPTTVLFDKSNCLYGLQQARHQIVASDTAVVVEGYTDCIMAHQFGVGNVVATLGTSFTDGHGRVLRRYAKKVILIFDSDTAGIEAANRAIEICLSHRIDIRLAFVPEGKDPCDFLLTAGKERFEQVLSNAVDVFEFKWKRLSEKFAGEDTVAGKKAAVDEYLQTVATAVWAGKLSPIETGLIVNKVSSIVGLEGRQLAQELRKRVRTMRGGRTNKGADRESPQLDFGQGLLAGAQREILEVLLNEPRLFELVGRRITVDDFDVPILKQVAAIVFETLSAGGKLSVSEMLARIESQDLAKCVVELQMVGQRKGNFRERLADALNIMEKGKFQTQPAGIDQVEDKGRLLRRSCTGIGKENPHSIGMT